MTKLIKLNDVIRELHDELMEFERKVWNEEHGEPDMIDIWIVPRPAYNDWNYYLEVNVKGENCWTKARHDRFCNQFGVVLSNVQKHVCKTANNYGDGFEEKWTYTYKPEEWKNYNNLRYDDLAVVEFQRANSIETVRLELTINNDFTDNLCVSPSFYDALKECSPNNTSVMCSEDNLERLNDAVRNDRETGFVELLSAGDILRFKKWKR